MKKPFLIPFLFFALGLSAQNLQRPKLVVGIVVDQMRWDYLYRYYNRYGSGGFKRLLGEGFSCENTFIPYTPTYTAAGHTCIYTGSVPALHGIMGNFWYDRDLKRSVYCTEDSSVRGLGTNTPAAQMSPSRMWSNTITDELRLATNFHNKTIAIALKDRGAILPGGHTANAAYWYDMATGNWISSSFYMNALPDWVNKFNARKLPDSFLKKNWNTLYPIETYTESTTDNKPYEDALWKEDQSFPHRTDTMVNARYESFEYTPYGNSYTFEMARAAIANEHLGKTAYTDFLALSFSSTDYIGHAQGPNSIEIEDTYLRFDKELSSFLSYLDQTVGKGQYLLFLTADHGAAHVAGFEEEHHLPAGSMEDLQLRSLLNAAILDRYNLSNIIASVINYQVYLNRDSLSKYSTQLGSIRQFLIDKLLQQPGIATAIDLHNLENATMPSQVKTMIINGYNQKLSGDIQFTYKPQWYDRGNRGTTHGAWYPYDAHIPLVWFGWKVAPGKTNREVYMTDIAPTIAAFLHIQMPNASIGKVITELNGK